MEGPLIKTKILNFSKPVDNFSSLFLDNGVASLAASILEYGGETTIEDYGRLDMISYFRPPAGLSQRIKELSAEIQMDLAQGESPDPAPLNELREAGRELKKIHRKQIDQLAQHDAEKIIAEGIDVVLFKVWNGQGTYYFLKTLEKIRDLEKKSGRKVFIFGGGPQVGWFNTSLLGLATQADGLILGEGEQAIKTILDFVQGKGSYESIPGLLYRKGARMDQNPPKWIENLDRIAKPVYDPDIYLANSDDQKVRFVMLDESRGCPNRCFFCNHYIESGGEWRSKSAGRIVDEIEDIIETMGTRYFRYSGSSTPPSLRRAIAEEIIQRRLKIRYTTFINTNTTHKDDLQCMKESGCFGVFFGIESGNEGILRKSIGAKNTREGIRYAVRSAKEVGLFTVGSLIIPAPFDTPETIKDTLDFVISLGLDAAPVLPPGLTGTETQWAKESETFGIQKDPDWVDQMMFWDVNLLTPVMLWEKLPYRVNGLDFFNFIKITGQAASTLLRHGIPQTSDEMALMADLNRQTPHDFLQAIHWDLTNADEGGIREKVISINQALKREPLP